MEFRIRFGLIMGKETVIYLYQVEDLLGGEGLSTYDLTLIASKNIKWHEREEKENDLDIAA